MEPNLPTRTVTFFFSDMEGSARLVQELGHARPAVLETHDQLFRIAIGHNGGTEVRTIGNALFVAFASVGDAVATAAEVQRPMAEGERPDGRSVRVRIGLHTGLGAEVGEPRLSEVAALLEISRRLFADPASAWGALYAFEP